MQSKLYRFEIVRALNNAVFEAIDSVTGATVFLYEWTPAIADRAAAKFRLEEVKSEQSCEVFTADASLYLAAVSRTLGQDSLNILRSHGLFAGTWLDDAPKLAPPMTPPGPTPVTPPYIPPVAPPPARPAPVPPQKSRVGLVFWTMVFSAIPAFIGGIYVAKNIEDADYQSRAAASSESGAAERRQLQDQLNTQTQAANEAVSALATYTGTSLLRVKNTCQVPIRAVALYTDYNRARVVKGWTAIGAGETAILAASPSPDFEVYAEDLKDERSWYEGSHTPVNVTSGDFIYLQNNPTTSDREVHTYTVHIATPGQMSVLDCRK